MLRIRNRLRSMARPLAMRTLIPASYDIHNTIVLTGVPRSGTTWLAELLNRTPHSAILFEPLNINRVPAAARAGFTWSQDLDADDRDPRMLAYMEAVLRGRVINSWVARDLDVSDCIGVRHLIVKFVRAENLLHWITANFPVRRPLFIIRHPCAVVASQMRRIWKEFTNQEILLAEPVLKRHPHLLPLTEGLQTLEEQLAAKWCLQNYKALSGSNDGAFHLVVYERLVTNGEAELARIFAALGMDVPAGASEQLRTASVTAHHGNPWHSDAPLEGWSRVLKPAQVERVLSVVEAFGMDFYSRDFEPDYVRLEGPGSPLKVVSG